MRLINKLSLAGAATAAAAALAGCVPIPLVSGYEDASRQNVPAAVPDFIVQGTSSRTDVLLALGEPDRSADDESWFLYGSIYSKGGLMLVGVIGGPYAAAFVGVGEETMRYRLLTVRFDAAGIVSGVELTQRSCREWLGGAAAGSGGSAWRSDPCVDASGDEQVTAHRATREAQGEIIVAQFPRAGWWAGVEQPPDIPLWSPPARARGAWVGVAVTDRTIVLTAAPGAPPANLQSMFTLDAPAGPLRLPLASIDHASVEQRYLFIPYVSLVMKNGSRAAFIVIDRNGTLDAEQTEAAATLINERIKALETEPPPVSTESTPSQ